MNGAEALPMISPRLWFSMTIVKTVPPQSAERRADVVVIARQATNALPEVFGPEHPVRLARASEVASRARLVRCIVLPGGCALGEHRRGCLIYCPRWYARNTPT